MKRLVLFFCLFFTLPVHAVQLELGEGNYTAGNDIIKEKLQCVKLKDASLYKRAKIKYKSFAKLYKKKTLEKYLRKVVFCHNLALGSFWQVRGSYNLDKKILFIQVDRKSNDTKYILHHEFSSILLNLHPKLNKFREKWISNNSVYYKPLYHMTSGKSGYRGNFPMLRMQGFLYPYSRTNFENDFNVMAAFYKSDYLRHKLDQAANNYSKINNKFLLIKEFYRDF